jgi:hypothetical protein
MRRTITFGAGLFLCLFFAALTAKAADVCIYSTTPINGINPVFTYLRSVDTNRYINREDVLINPSTMSVIGVPLRYWKVVNDATIEEMTQPEKDQVEADILAERILNVHEGGKILLEEFDISPIVIRAFADIVKDEINILRGWDMDLKAAVAASNNLEQLKANIAALPDLPDRTLPQLKQEIKDRIDSGDVD